MPSFVRGYVRAVDPDRGPVVHGSEVEQQVFVFRYRVFERPGVPDHVVEDRLSDAGEFGLGAERDGDHPVARRVTRPEVLR